MRLARSTHKHKHIPAQPKNDGKQRVGRQETNTTTITTQQTAKQPINQTRTAHSAVAQLVQLPFGRLLLIVLPVLRPILALVAIAIPARGELEEQNSIHQTGGDVLFHGKVGSEADDDRQEQTEPERGVAHHRNYKDHHIITSSHQVSPFTIQHKQQENASMHPHTITSIMKTTNTTNDEGRTEDEIKRGLVDQRVIDRQGDKVDQNTAPDRDMIRQRPVPATAKPPPHREQVGLQSWQDNRTRRSLNNHPNTRTYRSRTQPYTTQPLNAIGLLII